MTRIWSKHPQTGRRRAAFKLLAAALLLLAAAPALAVNCSDAPYFGVIDGDIVPAPSQIQIDTNCTVRNFPAGNPLVTNFSFLTQPGQTDERWLVVFDNVVHLGNMSCNATHEHKIWFVNGSSSKIKQQCQNLLIPVEKIEKQNPPGQSTVVVGEEFTYRLIIPVLFDPATDAVINFAGSPNDLHGVVIQDDLNATGVDLSYLGHSAYWLDSGAAVPHSFANIGGLLTFELEPIVPAERQLVIEITVVLDDSSANVIGTQFVNIAKWQFGRLIDEVFYEPLPGEWGISAPLTIVGPELTLTKSGPAEMNLGENGDFRLDIQNIGTTAALFAKILDRLPSGPTGGLCNFAPVVLGAGVYAADGLTPVPGKGVLTPGVDFAVSFSGVPRCEISLEILTDAGAIGPDERLIIDYQARLDAGSQDGAMLTNVAGAVEWSHLSPSGAFREIFRRELTDGTVGELDHEDAHTVTVALAGNFFEKTVANLATGADPTETAGPGDTLRYTLRLRTTDEALQDVAFYDDLGALNAEPVFTPGSLSLVSGSLPPGADITMTNPDGGTHGAGLLDIRNLSVAAGSEISLQFDITLAAGLEDGMVVRNQAELRAGGDLLRLSDDPNINGPANPLVAGDEEPTRVLIETIPAPPLRKAATRQSAAIGEAFSYRLTVPATPHSAPIFDVRVFDDLAAAAADLEFVDVARISGSGAWQPVNTGTSTRLVIEDPDQGIDIPAGEQVVLEITVRLRDTSRNTTGLEFTNTASYSYNLVDGDAASGRLGGAGTSAAMFIAAPELTLEKNGPVRMLRGGAAGSFTLNVHNVGNSPAYGLTITDRLPDTDQGGMCEVAPTQFEARLYAADGVAAVGPPLVLASDYAIEFAGAPDCVLTIRMLSTAAAIGPDQRLLVNFELSLDADTEQDATLTNIAAATSWWSVDPVTQQEQAREDTRQLTNGTVGVLDHEDAHTITGSVPVVRFEKTVVNLDRGDAPGTLAAPGETLRYRLVVENLSDAPINDFRIRDELDRLNDRASFQAGTLRLVTIPVGADASNSSASGGAKGTGVLDIRDLRLGGRGDNLLIEFDVTLAPILANAGFVLNQALMLSDAAVVAQSDDPNINGAADPEVFGDEEPTRIRIESAPAFRVEKVSSYPDGDPVVLLAGERLEYTITVRNIGSDHAVDAMLRDEIPVNTSYVAGSVTLNGAPVPDGAEGKSPLSDGILINAPGDAAPGSLPAAGADAPDAVATISFTVRVNEDVIDGTVIANQAFVSAAAGGVSDQPSNDPRTPIVDDPTRDVVGNFPLLIAEKTVVLAVDAGSPGIVDPGDVLRYTITLHNLGNEAATGVMLTDPVPPDTTYVADSMYLNELPIGQPDGGVSPLATGIDISSADLTPPLPGPSDGILSPGGTASVRFDVRVNDAVPSGTIISNQAVVATEQLPDQLTDGDGNPDNGAQPTEVVVGDRQQLAISKQVAVVGGGPAAAGAQLEYLVRVVNIGAVPAFDVVLSDDLDAPLPGQLSYVAGSAVLNGSTAGLAFNDATLTADYSTVYGPLPPGGTAVLRFRAVMAADLALGTTVTNTAAVRWNTPAQTAVASVSVDVGGAPGVGILNGFAWHDEDFDRSRAERERALEGWAVVLYRNGGLVHTTLTRADGSYRISGLTPNTVTGDGYALHFSAPGAGPNTATLGAADSPFTDGPQQIDDVVVASGSNLQNLNLPIDPNGVVYDSVARAPIAGATLYLQRAGSGVPLPAACFDDPVQQGQVTSADGYYKFDLNFSDPACPSGSDYLLDVVAPPDDFLPGVSRIIPPLSDVTTPAFVVPACPGSAADAVLATAEHCEAQVSAAAPPPSARARSDGTNYYLHLALDNSQAPGSSQLFNNHIPLDPELEGALAISKTSPLVNVSRGQLVPYVITINNVLGVDLQDVRIVDRFPAGFRYVEGSARLDGTPSEPAVAGRELSWDDLGISDADTRTLALLLAVGAGVGEGEYVNHAQALHGLTGGALSGVATATVRVVPDPTFDCTDVLGKVFDDANRNGVQDAHEPGLPGVRVVTARGLVATTDAHGRFHITCAVTPREDRGSNFVLKLDDRSLPSGYRMSTDQVLVQRATRGKALRFNFGASLHRVVSLDIADGVFVPDGVAVRRQWQPRMQLLLDELRKAPAVLRLSYLADLEGAQLVERRLAAISNEIETAWRALDCCYELELETEVFWRRGKPAERPLPPGRAGR